MYIKSFCFSSLFPHFLSHSQTILFFNYDYFIPIRSMASHSIYSTRMARQLNVLYFKNWWTCTINEKLEKNPLLFLFSTEFVVCVFLFLLDFLKSRSCIDLFGFGCVFVVILCDLLIVKACVSMMHAYHVRKRARTPQQSVKLFYCLRLFCAVL